MPTRQYYPLKEYFPGAKFHQCDPQQPFQGFCHDTRLLQEGELFLAFQGARAHGYAFTEQAQEQGALATVVESSCPLPLNGPTIVVPDLMAAIVEAAYYHRRHFPGKLYALTGTAGKTSTKEYFAQLAEQLEHSPPFFISYGNWNNTLGLAVNISRLPLMPMINLFELGISGPGDMDELVEMLRPDAVAITSIGEAHLEKLHSCAGVAHEKQKIARYADKGWTTQQALPFFEEKMLDWQVVDHNVSVTGPLFKDNLFKTTMRFQKSQTDVYSPGLFHGLNFFLARALLNDQLSHQLPSQGSVLITVPKGRGSLDVWGQWGILDDTYNASIPSLRTLLDVLQRISEQETVGLVLSDLSELGPAEDNFLDELFEKYPPIPSRLYYYYTGRDPLSWVRRGATIFSKTYDGVQLCFDHAKAQGIRLMAFKASRTSGLEQQMHLFIGCIQAHYGSLVKNTG